MDEPPELTGPDSVDDFPENSGISRQVGRYTAADPEGATVTLSLSSGDADFALASNGIVTFKESPDYEDQSTYNFIVRAVAGTHTVNRTVTVNIENLEEPGTVTLSTVQPQEGTSLEATLEDDDVPAGTTWQWHRASSRGSTGTAITGANSRFYSPDADDVGSYLRAVASYNDGHGTDKTAAAVSANRVQEAPPDPEPPVFDPNGDYTRTIRENQSAGRNLGAPVRATDGNNDRLTYSIPASDYFEIDPSSGQLRTKVELDHEATPTLNIRVTVTDPGGLTDTVTVTITVEDVDETPVISGPQTVDFDEGGTGTVATYTATDPDDTGIDWVLTGTDREDFTLSSGGILTFNEEPDFENPADSGGNNDYRITIEAHEQSPGTSVARLNATVRVTNVDEPGVVEANAEEPRVGQTLRLKVEDDDGGESVSKWKWEKGEPNSPCGTVDSPTVTNWETIPGASGSSYTPTAADQGHCIRVTAIYNDRAGTGRSEQFLTAETVEFGPYFDADTASGEAPENSPEGRNIGTYRARHANSGETLTYSLAGADARFFTVDPAIGQLKTSDMPLDYESLPGPEAAVDITATDSNGETATVAVTVAVTDVCDGATTVPGAPSAPSVSAASSTSLRVSWSEASGSCITSYEVRHTPAGSNSWSPPTSAGTTRSREITGLSSSTTYEVQVRARNLVGLGGWSSSGSGTTSSGGGGGNGGNGGNGGGGSTSGGGGPSGGGGGGFASPPAAPRPVSNFQAPAQVLQPLIANQTLKRVWRFYNNSKSWVFYDPRPEFARFNTLRSVNLAESAPPILVINVDRQQQFRGYTLYPGWNHVPIEAEPPSSAPRNVQPVAQLFSPLIQNGTLDRLWWLDSRTQAWKFFDPASEFASFNTLTTVDLGANPPVVVQVRVTRRQEFRGQTLYSGWNHMVLR